MARFIYEFEGVRGRNLKLYDTKIVISTKVTAGSLLTGNVSDGEKTIFLCDIVGVQFKKSGALIGYLQFETPSLQMNNNNSNMFSENTFTFETARNGITNDLMEAVYNYVTDRIECLKYGITNDIEVPDFDSIKSNSQNAEVARAENNTEELSTEHNTENTPPKGEQCQLCGNYFDHLTLCVIKDSFGTRYRSICDDCIVRYNAKPQKIKGQ